MLVKLIRSKIHRATVTRAALDYEGSIGIDGELLELAGLLPGEAVHVWNVNNGRRFETYALPSPVAREKSASTVLLRVSRSLAIWLLSPVFAGWKGKLLSTTWAKLSW